ncbi:MAG: dienelactone hydrolase family protein [Burkholderiaceae bacterium]
MKRLKYLLSGLAMVAFSFNVTAQEEVRFDAIKSENFPAISGPVRAVLQKGAGDAEKKAAVVILHGAGGVDGRGQIYASRLNAAGISTLEVIMFSPGQRSGPSQNRMAYAFSALKYLQARRDVDPGRIGILGFSSGGQLAVKTAIPAIASEFLKNGEPVFAAHAANYPVCWAWAEDEAVKPDAFYFRYWKSGLSGRPILLQAGGKDKYEDADSCQRFLQWLPEEQRRSIDFRYYPDATHLWDSQRGSFSFYERLACKERGCEVPVVADAKTTEQSINAVVEHFIKHIATAR